MSKLKRVHRGDDGFTDLGSERVWKGSTVLELVGSLDEVASILGVAKCYARDEEVSKHIAYLQRVFLELCSRIAMKDFSGLERRIEEIEEATKRIWESHGLKFALVEPGPPKLAAYLHLARAACRRAERWAWRSLAEGSISSKSVPLVLNRASDLLYALARLVEEKWGRARGG